MNTLVIDASIAVKWVVEEDGTAEALVLRQKAKLTAPDLIIPECANILWKKVRRNAETDCRFVTADQRLLRKLNASRSRAGRDRTRRAISLNDAARL